MIHTEESWDDVEHLVFSKNDRDGNGELTVAELSAALTDRYGRSADAQAARDVTALRILHVCAACVPPHLMMSRSNCSCAVSIMSSC